MWMAELATDEASEADRAACEAWCRENQLHRVAMKRLRGMDVRFGEVEAPHRKAIERLLDRKRAGQAGKGALLLGGVLLAGAGWLASQSWVVRGFFPDAATERGEQRSLVLGDGHLRLDTDSAIDVAERTNGSRITMFRGRVLAKVTPRPHDPFVIETPEGTVSALGTSFIVERRDRTTLVTVIESRVRACARMSEQCRELAPGQRAAIDGSRISPFETIDTAAAAAWTDGWLVANDRLVSDMLDELNRYRAVPVRYDADRIRGIRISGSFPLTDTDRALNGMARATGLRLTRSGENVTVDRE